jgi:calmodulin
MEEYLTEDQINECRETFKMFDKDGDGQISAKELGIVMRQLGLSPTEDEIIEMILEVDEDGNGEINFDEFLTIMAHKMKDADTELGTLEAFRVFDRERTGMITKSELKNIIMHMGEPMSEEVTLFELDSLGHRRPPQRGRNKCRRLHRLPGFCEGPVLQLVTID